MEIKEELNNLEDGIEDLIGSHANYSNIKRQLEDLERKIRKHAYPELIKQSNTQKMQLAFEHSVALDQGTWTQWTNLKNGLDLAEQDLEENKLRWEYVKIRVDLIKALKDDNME